MTVYADDWRQHHTNGRVTGAWPHLFAGPWDNPAELHALAAAIGLRRAGDQDKSSPRAL